MAKYAPDHRHLTPRCFHRRTRLKIGLLGGSFNPAHDGHLHITAAARRQLDLDEVWWLVSPQNPLKSHADMAPLDVRLSGARQIATKYPFLRVMAPEAALPHNYTYNTLLHLKKTLPAARLVWIMGADNLAQLSQWYRYRALIRLLPIAVVNRPRYALSAIRAGQRLFKRRYRTGALRAQLRGDAAHRPGWCFIAGPTHAASATAIRQAAVANRP